MASFNTDRISDRYLGITEEPSVLRCRKCRRCVADSTCLLSAPKEFKTTCSVWHIDVDTLPDWILTVVNKVHWTVGKLNCQYCGARLGGFNFLNYLKCPCGHDTTVHFSKSRVDEGITHFVYLSRPGRPGGHAERLECQEGCLGKQNELEGSEVRDGFQPNPNLSHDVHLVTETLSSETDSQTMKIQAAYLGGDLSVISCCSVPSFHHSSSTHKDFKEAQAVLKLGKETQNSRSFHTNNESHRDIETLDYLGGTEDGTLFPLLETPALDTEAQQEQEDIGTEVTEEVLSGAASRTVQLSKREKNRLKSLKRKQRKKERWFQSQLEDQKQSVTSNDDEEKEGYTCAVCLDVYYNPYMCQPCSHVFCEPCLRTLARNRPSSTPCPLCRTLIRHVLFQTELHQSIRSHFLKEYLSRKEAFQQNNYSKWPLPNCPKQRRILWGRQGASRWNFPHRTFRLDALDLGEMQGWPFDSEGMTFSFFHWVLALIIFCGLYYFFLY